MRAMIKQLPSSNSAIKQFIVQLSERERERKRERE
jgi:hypothetical protein